MQSASDLWTLNAARQQRSETLANFSLRWKLWTVHNSYVYIVQFTRRMSDFRVKKFQTLLQNLLRVLSLSHIKWPQNLFSHTMQRKWIFVAFGPLWVRRVVTFNWPFICSTWSTKCSGICRIGWSEKHKSLKSKNEQADFLPRHGPDVRTVFEI